MTTAQPRPSATTGTAAGPARELTLELPMVTVRIHPPELRLPRPRVAMPRVNRQEVGHAVDVARSLLPPPERVAYYGALGALAVAGVIEWPVAAAIGAGTVIAQRARSKESAEFSAGPRQAPASARAGTPALEPAERDGAVPAADSGAAGDAVRPQTAERDAGARASRGKKTGKAET